MSKPRKWTLVVEEQGSGRNMIDQVTDAPPGEYQVIESTPLTKAAGEMLEALVNIRLFVSIRDRDDVRDVVKAADAAIARAKGEI